MTEAEELKIQLIAIRCLSNEVEREVDSVGRRLALEHMQRSIQNADIVLHYASDLMVSD